MENEKNFTTGSISVSTEHIFPVIKKWLYSEKEIFLRELVSNACDAVTKMKRLSSLGEISLPEDEKFAVTVRLDPEEQSLTISDNGIGMSRKEVEKYICSIALSGAMDFMEKYEQSTSDGSGIIGHFGLGFYSAFMVADKVRVFTQSMKGEEDSVCWVCDEQGSYTYEECTKRERGTDVVLYLSEEGKEYLEAGKLRAVLDKYCAFMPVEIYFEDGKDEKEGEEQAKEPINDISPLWLKRPSECTDEEYTAFYRKVFNDYKDPLFHIHINADYPLNFKGILYFPRLNSEYDNMEGQVKLFYNQVFVADNIKEVIPDYFLMLKGVLDCPELPLNVSRSYLQNSGYVSKIAAHIVKKTADKLQGLFNTERERYEKLWDDLKLFVEYGSLRDKKFYDRVKKVFLLPLTDGRHLTFEEYAKELQGKEEGKIFYAADPVTQAQYISLYTDRGIPVALFDKVLDSQFFSLAEAEEKVKFVRVDAEISDSLKEGEIDENEGLKSLFASVCPENTEISFASLKDGSLPALLNVSEEERRMKEMMRMYGMDVPMGEEKATLILNGSNALLKKLADCTDEDKKKDAAAQIYALALLSQRPLTAEEMKKFLAGSFKTIENGL
ncbi:MAG: molecular chaperone HtpG [Clostridia bacterium]|nr:molecular chaperone HtpG [Clostridia bacterium]